jgi:hypothetical protein
MTPDPETQADAALLAEIAHAKAQRHARRMDALRTLAGGLADLYGHVGITPCPDCLERIRRRCVAVRAQCQHQRDHCADQRQTLRAQQARLRAQQQRQEEER